MSSCVSQKLCNCATIGGVKNITVSVPDDVYRAARVQAAERGSSVSALVADYLRSLSGREAEFERLEEKRRRIIAGIEGFRAADRLSRDELYDRGVR
jgi:plasmid stability protein